MWSITSISNLFNIITYLHPNLKRYHFGYRDDILTNIANNYDLKNEIGNQYPSVHWDVPDQIEGSTAQSGREAMFCRIWFDDLKNRDMKGAERTATAAEQWTILQVYARQFMNGLDALCKEQTQKYKRAIGITNQQWIQKPNSDITIDDLISVEMTFTLTYTPECTTYIPNTASLPPTMPYPLITNEDYEDPEHFNDMTLIIP